VSHIKGRDLRTLKRLIKAHGVENVIGETHEVAAKRNPRRSRPRSARRLTVPQQHMLKIARDTLNMSDAMARVMGGMTKAEARDVIVTLTGRVPRGNPRRRRVSTKARRFIGRTIRRLAHRGERAPQRIAIAYAKARRRGFKVPKRGRRNPWGPGQEFRSIGPIKTVAQLKRTAKQLLRFVRPDSRMAAAAYFAMRQPDAVLARPALQEELLDFLKVYAGAAKKNPHLAVVGAMNPPLGQAIELRYHRVAGEHPGYYRHKFTSRATVFAMKDGSLRIVGR
jgi:hypothetical protein